MFKGDLCCIIYEFKGWHLQGHIIITVDLWYDLLFCSFFYEIFLLFLVWHKSFILNAPSAPYLEHKWYLLMCGDSPLSLSLSLSPFPLWVFYWGLQFKGLNFAGDVAFRILDTVNSIKRRALQDVLEDDLQEETRIYVCDINPNMLNVGKKRALERGKIEGLFMILIFWFFFRTSETQQIKYWLRNFNFC